MIVAGGVKRFGDVLHRLLKAKRFHEKCRYGPLVDAWQDVVGREVASRTRICSYEHGRLTIEVDSSVLMYELAGFMKQSVLQELRARPGGEDVADLWFCLGRPSERPDDPMRQ